MSETREGSDIGGTPVALGKWPWAWWSAAASLLLVLAASRMPFLAPGGLAPRIWEISAWIVLGALAAGFRPLAGASLGLGAFVVVPAMARLGAAPAVVVGVGAHLLGGIWPGVAERLATGHKEKPGLELGGMAGVAFSTLAAGASFALGTQAGWSLPATAVVTILAYATTRAALLTARDRATGVQGDVRGYGLVVLLEGAGLVLGFVVEAAAQRSGWALIGPLAMVIAGLAAVAAHLQRMRGIVEARLLDLERLQQAHVRILTETSGMAGIAQQILVECGNVLPLGWFQFELLAEQIGEEPGETADGPSPRSWSAGPDGVLFKGEPDPAPRPEMLPGIHRRASWQEIRAPLEAEGEPLAVVRLWCDPRRFEPGAEKLFSTLVPQMASSVHRAFLDREAKLDPLTGVPVRRILETSLQKAYRHCFEEGQSMAVIMCDIDFFKKVNDVHGHAAGDDALKLVAHTLASKRREGDLCCRYGGEEFTLLLEKTDGPSALQLAERLRIAVESLDLVYEGRPIPLTLSLGVAAFPEVHIKTASELLLLADEALYQCKGRGRNQCLLYLGNHRFQGPGGEVVTREVAEAALAPPRIFG